MRQWEDKATNMTVGGLLFLALLVPGLVLAILVVAIVLPRALRDERRLREHRCPHCGHDLDDSPGPCPACGRSTHVEAPPPPNGH
jgi:hypothetical protein